MTQSTATLVQSIESDRAAQVPGVVAQNNSLSATAVYEQNERTVNDVFLQSTARGAELSSQQIATLEPVALQCPYSGGSAVLRARSMLLGKTQLTFDNSACNGQGQQLVRPNTEIIEPAAHSYHLFPNPAKESFTLSVRDGSETQRDIQVVDIYGKVLMAGVLDTKEHKATFNTNGLVSGVYFVKVWEDGKEAFAGKIIVQ